ncbi:MAG: RNA polymerase sigma factor SigM [Actinomycetota bacterium]|nr:RNA polymerase sigma factor SigM [Actinomycetota bacterium]
MSPRPLDGRAHADLDDRELMAAHLAGDPDAFGVIVSRHRDRMWAVAIRTLGDREEAADAVQDALVSAYRRADSYRGDAAVSTWLHRIVVNACLDRVRRAKARPSEPLPEHQDHAQILGHQPHDTADAAEQTETRQLVLTALRSLTPEHRSALVLVDMEGYSVGEAAEMLGCPTGTVKSRCARARAKLLPMLAALRPGGAAAGDPPERPGRDSTDEQRNRSAPASVTSSRRTPAPAPERSGGDHRG